MRQNVYFLLMAMAAVCASCGSADESRDNTINLSSTPKEKLTLGDIIEPVKLTKIESPDSFLLNGVAKAIEVPGGYVLLSYLQEYPVVAYSDAGQFLCSYGRIGHGPGEYPGAEDIALSPGGDSLLVTTRSMDVYSYSLDGTFGRRIPTDDLIPLTKIATNSNRIAMCEPDLIEGVNRFFLFTPDMKNTFSGLPSTGDFSYPFYSRMPIDKEFAYFLDWYNNKLYQITTVGDSISDVWTITMPKDLASCNSVDRMTFISNQTDYDYIMDWSVADGRFVAFYFLDGALRYVLYDLEKNAVIKQGTFVGCPPEFLPAREEGYFISIINDADYEWYKEYMPQEVELPSFDADKTDAILMVWRLKTAF